MKYSVRKRRSIMNNVITDVRKGVYGQHKAVHKMDISPIHDTVVTIIWAIKSTLLEGGCK